MRFRDLLSLALSNLFRRKFRTIMTVLGVVIGTASIVSMLSLGYGLQRETMSNFDGKKALKEVTIYSANEYSSNGRDNWDDKLTDKDLEELKSDPDVKIAIPTYSVEAELALGKWESHPTIMALDDEALKYYDFVLQEGSMPEKGSSTLSLAMGLSGKETFYNTKKTNDFETLKSTDENIDVYKTLFRAKFYNWQLMNNLTPSQQEQFSQVTNKSIPVKITGVVAERKYTDSEIEQFASWQDPYSYKFFAYKDDLMKVLHKYFKKYALPNQKAKKNGEALDEISYSSIILVTDGPDKSKELYDRLKTNTKYRVESQIDFITSSQEGIKNIQYILAAIGGISLLVAAIGIANTMMMSIYERTKEIGIFKVLGCDLAKIRNMIIIESAGIGVLGGIIGLILSYILSAVINNFTADSSATPFASSSSGLSYIPPLLAIFSIIFAGLIGTLSGLLPAIRAMKLSPLKAIRND